VILLAPLFAYILKATRAHKIAGLFSVMVIVFALVIFAPQFQDGNASWRLYNWVSAFHIILTSNYGILGEGFGVPYITPIFHEGLDNFKSGFSLEQSQYCIIEIFFSVIKSELTSFFEV